MTKQLALAVSAALALTAGTAAAQAKPDATPAPAAKPAPAPAADPAAQARADLDKTIELLRKDARAEKADLIAKNMGFDAAQAAAFWPIYKNYEADAKKLGDERLAILKDLAASIDTLDDAKASKLLDRQIALEGKKVELARKYKVQLAKALPGKVVARFFQIDSRLNKLIELAIASEVPLVF